VIAPSRGENRGRSQKEAFAMSGQRASIAQVMMVVALAAVNLAVLRITPLEIVTFPSIWVVLGSIDFVIIWKLILTRSLRAFHYTFLIVFVVVFFVMANFVATERLHPLGLLVHWYQRLTVDKSNSISPGFGFLWIGEFWMACFLSFVLAYATGLVAAWFEKRRDWDIAAFWRGTLVGFAIANLLAIIDGAVWGWMVESRVRLIGHLVLLGVCLILGGLIGLSRLKSSALGREGNSG
jgi:hypothetical protein